MRAQPLWPCEDSAFPTRKQEVAHAAVNAASRQTSGKGNSSATNTTAHLPARGRAGKLQNQPLLQGPTAARPALPHARAAAEHPPVSSVPWSPALRPRGTCQGLGGVNPLPFPGCRLLALLDLPPCTQREQDEAQRAWLQGFSRRKPSLRSAPQYLG